MTSIPEEELPYNYGMKESVINLEKDKIMENKVGYGLRGKVWFGAFEDGNDVVCVANFNMPAEKAPEGANDWVWKCEKIYRATQNMFDSWSLTLEQINNSPRNAYDGLRDNKLTEKQDGADWIYPKNFYRNYGHRSMSCGDVIQFGIDNDKKRYFGCAGFGFVELTYEEYSKWHDMESRERSWYIDEVKKAKYKEEEVAC